METLKKVYTLFYFFSTPYFDKMIPKIYFFKLMTRHKHEFYNL